MNTTPGEVVAHSPSKKILQLQRSSARNDVFCALADLLRGQIIDHSRSRVILLRKGKYGCNPYARVKVRDHRRERDDEELEVLARIGPLIQTPFLRKTSSPHLTENLTFWGSSGSSLGCGQSTFFPSEESFNRLATRSPNSMRASLVGIVSKERASS